MSGTLMFFLFVFPVFVLILVLAVTFGSGFPASLAAVVVSGMTTFFVPMPDDSTLSFLVFFLGPMSLGGIAAVFAGVIFGVPVEWFRSNELLLLLFFGFVGGLIARSTHYFFSLS